MLIEEVHLWRGTPTQRAMRSQLVKATQFAYFNEQLEYPEWRDKLVLDFGGNKGNLLLDPECAVSRANYYCLDVIRDAIETGRETFPDAHWFHYDRYNRSFNPEGVIDLPVPDLGVRFDFILAYSVFTHTTFEEMKDLVAQLQTFLAPGGTLAFTFIDPHYRENLRWRLTKSGASDIERLVDEAAKANWCALVNGTDLYVDSNGPWNIDSQDCATYNVYYSEQFFRRVFPRARVEPPLDGEMQHCAVLRKEP